MYMCTHYLHAIFSIPKPQPLICALFSHTKIAITALSPPCSSQSPKLTTQTLLGINRLAN